MLMGPFNFFFIKGGSMACWLLKILISLAVIHLKYRVRFILHFGCLSFRAVMTTFDA